MTDELQLLLLKLEQSNAMEVLAPSFLLNGVQTLYKLGIRKESIATE